jgi:hypothetical protein
VAQGVINADRVLFEPFPQDRAIDVVVISPIFVAGVVGWVNEDAIHLARIHGQKRLEGVQVVAVDDQIPAKINVSHRFIRMGHQRAIGHCQVMVTYEFFSLEVKFGHGEDILDENHLASPRISRLF